MKKFIYIIVSIMVLQLFVNSFSSFYAQTAATTFILESKKEVSKEELVLSKKVLHERLKGVGLKNFEIEVKEQEKQLRVTLEEAIAKEDLYDLLTTKGALAFMETYSYDKVLGLFENASLKERFQEELSKPNNTTNAVIGYASGEAIPAINEFFKEIYSKSSIKNKVKFCWSKTADENGKHELFALKVPESGQVPIGNTAIKEASTVLTDWGQPAILFSFNKVGATRWAKLTSQNIDQSIAIVIDDIVYSAPIVRGTINAGKAMITGNFERTEAKMLSAILQFGVLPVDLEVASY